MLKIFLNKISRFRRIQLALLILLMVIASLAEVVSLGAVIPFLGVLTQPDFVFTQEYFQPFISYMGYEKPEQLIVPITIIFIIAASLAGVIRLVLLYLVTKVSFAIGSDLSAEGYRRTLFQDYSVHLEQNSSDIINIIINQSDIVIKSVITPALILISSLIIMIGVIVALFFIDAQVTFASFLFFGIVYFTIVKLSRKNLSRNSDVLAKNSIKMTKLLQEGIGGIRDIILRSNQEFYSDIYKRADRPYRQAAGNNIFIANSPRPAVEALGISFIAILAFIVVQKSPSNIAILGALALGCQRLLPVMQQAYSSYASIMGSREPFNKLMGLLNQECKISDETIGDLKFERDIELKNISFRYKPSEPWVLRDISIKIPKGSSVGFVGPTGCGKSTLADIIMGLLVPTQGDILIDGVPINNENRAAWRSLISHVPQNIFLTDTTIRENIAFSESEELPAFRVKEAASIACIHETISKMRNGYDTRIGERGIKLSGGQRQRLGIARAVYNSSDLLVLDEATSALDRATEESVMKAINSSENRLTKVIIAHRISTLAECDLIFELSDCAGAAKRNYTDLISE